MSILGYCVYLPRIVLFQDENVNAKWLCDEDLDVQAKNVRLNGASENHFPIYTFLFPFRDMCLA